MAGHIAFDNTHNRPPGNGLLVVSGIDSYLSAGRYSINRIAPLHGLIHARPLRQAKEVGGCLMSVPGPMLPTWALQQVVGYLVYTGYRANADATEAAAG